METHTEQPANERLLYCNGQDLRRLAFAGLMWLEQNKDRVNSLNVFPVPDGDTGTNMVLTMRSANKRVENDRDEMHIGRMADKIYRGTLMGARGNSGVILSQIWRGFARVVKEHDAINATGFAEALQGSVEQAYSGVQKPVEGTILTVIKEGAVAARESAEKGNNLQEMLQAVLNRCQVALDFTPEQLPILKEAGVVDSGGQGLVYIFEGMARWLTGRMSLQAAANASLATATNGTQTAQALARPDDGVIENPYDVQFLLMGSDLDVGKVKADIEAMGDSGVVVGDTSLIKVHVHVKDPGQPLTYGVALGQLSDVVVENMQEQMEDMISGETVSPAANVADEPEITPIEPGQIGVMTVAPGDGLARVFISMGVQCVVDGGQTNNPSTEELLDAINSINTDKIVILPNNKNIILAAETARDISKKEVVVIPTRTVPQGLSALVSYDPSGELADVAEAMEDAASDVATAEITTAVRSVTIDNVEVAAGQIIGIVDGKLSASGESINNVLSTTLAAMDMDDREIITIYYGADIGAERAHDLVGQIKMLYPDLEVELFNGGQAHYHYILGAE